MGTITRNSNTSDNAKNYSSGRNGKSQWKEERNKNINIRKGVKGKNERTEEQE